MKGRRKSFKALPPLAGVLVLLGACGDHPSLPPVEPRPVVGATVACTANVRDETVTCGEGAPVTAGLRSLLVGGQNDRVRLLASGVAFDEVTQTLHTRMAVENLLGLPMGTRDGVTTVGLRVFFHSGPTATVGTGSVSVSNADGTADITARRQPYFAYDEIVGPGSASGARDWAFRVPPGVDAFAFELLVDSPLPFEEGVLRWTKRNSGGYFQDLWGPGGPTLYALSPVYGQGHTGTVVFSAIARSDDGGLSWPAVTELNRHLLHGLWGPDASTLYLAGQHWDRGSGVLLRSTGGTTADWRVAAEVPGAVLRAVGGSGANDVYAVGGAMTPAGWEPVVVHSADGEHWTVTRPSAAAGMNLVSVWSSGPADVYVVGSGADQGVILHSTDRGATWTGRLAPAGLTRVWGADAGHVWAIGHRGWDPPAGFILYSTDGGATWTETRVPGASLNGIWGPTPDDVYVVGTVVSGVCLPCPWPTTMILRFNGQAWLPMATPDAFVPYDVRGAGGDNVVVAAGNSVLLGTR